jgi:hypothetical protein
MKFVFIPFSLVTSFIAGSIGRAIFRKLWTLIDEQEPPEAGDRFVGWGRILAAGVLQAVCFSICRIVADRKLRTLFYTLTRNWPGDNVPEQK